MFIRNVRAVLIAAAALSLVACATPQPPHNVVEAPIVSNKANPSLDEIRQAAKTAKAGAKG